MCQKMCFFNVLKCPTATGLNSCKMVGSFEKEDEAKECKVKETSKIDNSDFIVLIHKLEYQNQPNLSGKQVVQYQM